MKNLEMYGVQEMNTNEMKKTDGGFLLLLLGVAVRTAIVGAAVAAVGGYLAASFEAGVKEGRD